MNVETPLLNYIHKMIDCITSAKVLYVDETTRGIVAQLLTQTEALSKDVFLMHQINIPINDKKKSNIAHLKAIVFVRPTHDNIDALVSHLKDPKHESYYIFFSNTLDEAALSRLAQADSSEVVQSVQEYYCDVYPINRDLWSLNKHHSMCHYDDEKSWTKTTQINYEREIEGIISFLLASKKKPLIRYSQSSYIAKKMSITVQETIETQHQLFGWTDPPSPPLLLILDRKEDPITPLLTQWTYQSMVHELMTINNSRLKFDKSELVINTFDDKFFSRNLTATFGDIGTNIRKLVDEYTKNTKENKEKLKSGTMADMRALMDKYPELVSKQGNVKKHVDITSELSKIVNQRKLLDISAIEQDIVSNYDPKSHFNDVERTIKNDLINDFDKIRLSLIFCIRYENKKDQLVSDIRTLLRNNLKNEEYKPYVQLIDIFLREFSSKNRKAHLFGDEKADKDLIKKLHMFVKGGIKGVENVYTQHTPLLDNIIDQAYKCKLPLDQFGTVNHLHKRQPNDIIIYIIGGATYEEALCVSKRNKEFQRSCNIVLGSSIIHNSESYLQDIVSVYGKYIDSKELLAP